MTRDQLVRIAHTVGASMLVRRRRLTDAFIRQMQSKAFDAIRRTDRLAGTATHPHAAYAHGVMALACEGIAQAITGWQTLHRRK